MNEELDYAEMLEIPVETVTVKKHGAKKRRKQQTADLSEQLVEEVNGRMKEAEETAPDPNYAESKQIEREIKPKRAHKITARHILIGEVVAVCALCAAIFFTNIFLSNSAINTFVRGLFQGSAQTTTDSRTYRDFTLSSVVNSDVEAEVAVSDTGVMSFTAKCSVYSPAEGKVKKVSGNAETGYTLEISHSDSFSTVISGLDAAYLAAGDAVMKNIPVGYSDGEGAINVMMYEKETLLNCYDVKENKPVWI